MAETAQPQNVLLISLPKAGEVAEYEISPDVHVKFGFYVSEVLFSCNGKDLVMTGEHGGVVVIKDYLPLAQEGVLPTFELHGGEEVPGNIYLFAFTDSALDVETAAGPITDHKGAEEYLDHTDSKGGIIPGAEDHSALDSAHAHSLHGINVLTYGELFSDAHSDLLFHHGDEAGYAPSLFGSVHSAPAADVAMCSFADTFDPLGDALQHVVDFHHSF